MAQSPVGKEGRVVFARLPAGRYELWASGPDVPKGKMTAVLPGPAEVSWRPQPSDALLVLRCDADGALARLGLEKDDLILAIDGSAIESKEHGNLLLAGAAGKDEVSLTIRRGTRAFDLAVPGKSLHAALESRSGYLHPTAR